MDQPADQRQRDGHVEAVGAVGIDGLPSLDDGQQGARDRNRPDPAGDRRHAEPVRAGAELPQQRRQIRQELEKRYQEIKGDA